MKMFKKSPLNLAIGVAIATCTFSTQATENVRELSVTKVQDKKEKQYKVEKVSSHKITTELVDTPKTITVITAEVLKDQGITSFNDALRNVSGVSTFGAGEGGGGNITTNDKITIRGFSANGNIYVDGIRDLSGYSRDMFNFEQLEVTKGASSSITGKGSSGGSVNLVTKRAKYDDFTLVDVSYDEAERARVGTDINKQLSDKVAVRLNALYTQGGDPLGNGVEEYQTTAIAPSITAQLNDKTTLTADLLYMKQDNNPMLGLPWVNANAATQLGYTEGPIAEKYWGDYYGIAKRDFEDVSVTLGTLVLEHQLADNILLRSQTRYGVNDKQSVIARPRFRTSGSRSETKYHDEIDLTWTQNLDDKNEIFVSQLDAIININTGRISHDLVVGSEFYQEEVTKQRLSNDTELTKDTVPLGKPEPNISYTGSITASTQPTSTKGKGWAFYALDSIKLNKQWLVTAGLRYEDYQAEGSTYVWERINNKWNRKFFSGVKSDGTFLSWNASIAYKPNENSNIYLGVANAQDPSTGDLKFGGYRPKGITQIAKLDPQEAKNYELGAKWDLLDGSLQVDTALFLTRKTVLDRDPDRNYFLTGEQEAKGFEFSVTGEITESLNVIASYTHQKTEVIKDLTEAAVGNGLSAAPEDTANVWFTYTNDKFIVGAGAEYSSGNIYWRRNRAFFDTGSNTLLNAMASYQVTNNLVTQLNIDNITDENHITDYSAKGHFRPGNPRNIKLSVRYQF